MHHEPEHSLRILNASRLIIRRAVPEEAELLSQMALRSKAYWGYSEAFMETCRRELTCTAQMLQEGEYFVACDDQAPVGFCSLSHIDEQSAELEALFVEPSYIGRGVGRILLHHAQKTAEQRGIQALIIQSDPYAAEFYRKLGGQHVGERESGSIPGRLLPVFSLPTAPRLGSQSHLS